MLFKAITIEGADLLFSIGDCPIQIGGNVGALAGIPNSKLFYKDTVVRGFDTEDGIRMFEGDTVYDNRSGEYIGIVVYNGGFFIHTKEGYEKKASGVTHIRVRSGTIQTIDIVCYEMRRSPLEFKFSENTFLIDNFVCKKNGIIVLSNATVPVSAEYIKMFTGLEVEGVKLYYGDFFNFGTVELINGIPHIRDLASQEVISLR